MNIQQADAKKPPEGGVKDEGDELRPDGAEISALRWRQSVFSRQLDAALPAPEVLLFALGAFRLVRSGRAIQFRAGTWLKLELSWGAQRQEPQSTHEG